MPGIVARPALGDGRDVRGHAAVDRLAGVRLGSAGLLTVIWVRTAVPGPSSHDSFDRCAEIVSGHAILTPIHLGS